MKQTEANEYYNIYFRHGEWWLSYLENTDEKARTLEVLLPLLLPLLNGRETIRVLDIGAGNGVLSIKLSGDFLKQGLQVELDAVEPSPALSEELMRNVQEAKLSDCLRHCFRERFEKIVLPEESYDLILCIGSIYGIAQTDEGTSPFGNMAKLLLPDGFLVIIVQTEQSPYKVVQRKLLESRYGSVLLSAQKVREALGHVASAEIVYDDGFSGSLYIELPGASSAGVPLSTTHILSLLAKKDFSRLTSLERQDIVSTVRGAINGTPPALGIQNRLYLLKKG